MTNGKTVVIVESPGKVAKIQAFLGNDYKVAASVGHIRDLPEKEIGVSDINYAPTYVPTERGQKVIKDLSVLIKDAKDVILATDPDREGEAIAWHLQEALNIKNPLRVTYTEITEQAVKAAISNPRSINYELVKAQEARRVLDRIVGYKVSPWLTQVIGTPVSAGRVQTPALRLVVEREKAINSFKMKTHYGVKFNFNVEEHISDGWHVEWQPKDGWLNAGDEYFLDKKVAEQIATVKNLTVTDYQEKESTEAPPAPFTTSSLQQAASNALRFSPKETMDLAQKLYENGHISYMRTDSPNLSDEALTDIRHVATMNDWTVTAKPRTWKSKAGSQEAHEAIRPTHFEVENAGDTENEQALYCLIRTRALASQLEEAEYAVTVVQMTSNIDGITAHFEGKGRRLVKKGWRVVLPGGDQTEENENELDNPIPKLKFGDKLVADNGSVLVKKTKPPARYTEASLIKALERLDIWRPSTYAAILNNIINRKYVILDKRQLKPTEQGENIIDLLLSKTFGFTDYEFTKKVEADLDKIAEGIKLYIDIVKPASEQLKQELNAFIESVGYSCECGRPLRHLFRKETKDKSGYDFFGCTGYPDCSSMYENVAGKPGPKIIAYMCTCKKADLRRFKGIKNGREYDFFSCPVCNLTFDSVDDHPVKRIEKKAQPSGFKCPECSGNLVRQQGTSKAGKLYDFFGCENYPKCTTSLSVSSTGEPIPKEKSEFKCKECGKDLCRLTGISKKGKPYDFFSCTGYPKCKASFLVGDDGKPK